MSVSQQPIDAAGATTPEGKANPSPNAAENPLSKWIVLRDESAEGFESLLNSHVERFRPRDRVEMRVIEDMCVATWRINRTWAMETCLIDEATERQPENRELTQVSNAFGELAQSPGLNL